MPPTEFLHECFTYNPESGILAWKVRPLGHFKNAAICAAWNSRMAGMNAGGQRFLRGRPSTMVTTLSLGGKTAKFTSHRIIFALMGIDVPDGQEIDHKDKNPFNNKLSNLRISTRARNVYNRTLPKGEAGLPRGVVQARGKRGFYPKFYAKIKFQGNFIRLGSFPTAEQAGEAYQKAAKELHGDFHCGDS
jgi:hypothetical protein